MKHDITPTTIDDPPPDAAVPPPMEDFAEAESSNRARSETPEDIKSAQAETERTDDTAERVPDNGDGESEPDDEPDGYVEIEVEQEPTVERGRDPVGRRTIEFEMSSVRQRRFLKMTDGQEAVVHVTCRGTDGPWKRVRVRRVTWGRRPY